jgi:hydrogenase-4 component B
MCFVKAFGVTFLARPRSENARHSGESGPALLAAMAALAVLTLVIGFTAGSITNVLSGVAADLSVFHSSEPAYFSTIQTVGLRNGFASISMPLILASLIVTIALTFFAVYLVSRNSKTKIGRTWDCGTTLSPRMEITGTGFSHSIVMIFRGALKPTKQTSIEYRDEEMRYFQKTNLVEFGIQDIYNSYFYQPVQMLTNKASEYVKRIQSGNINMYVLYILAILIALLFASGM